MFKRIKFVRKDTSDHHAPKQDSPSQEKTSDLPAEGEKLTGANLGHHRSRTASSALQRSISSRNKQVFRSRRIPEGASAGEDVSFYKTPAGKASKRKSNIVFWTVLAVGVAASAGLIAQEILKIPKHDFCLVLDEQFDGGSIDTNTWLHEQEVGGYGNGEFEYTTASEKNSWVEDGKLYIAPTLTADEIGPAALEHGYLLNLTDLGTCTATSNIHKNCGVFSNSSATNFSMIPPIQSARLSTRYSHSIKYGKVEIRLKLPTGDWIWPAVWMLPKDSVYGEWPRSGEIDIIESRGNGVESRMDLRVNSVTSTLHWGADASTDGFWRTTQFKRKLRKYFNQGYTTFGMEWNENGIFTWLDSPAYPIFAQNFKQPFWRYGAFGQTNDNGTVIYNPWSGTNVSEPRAAPFDQEFYFIMNVAVGGTTEYWADVDYPSKPWSNSGLHPMLDFWNQREKWLPTWPEDKKERALAVDYVKMWRQC